jgi:hypothetical protein
MRSTAGIPWTKLGFEGLLIIISILVAFGIDAWWSAKQLAKEEQTVIAQLQSEFESNSVLLESMKQSHQSAVAAAERLLKLTGPEPGESIDYGTVANDVYTVSGHFTFDPRSEVLNGFLASGKLALISDSSLRVAVAGWPVLISDLKEDEKAAWDFTAGQLIPYLGEHISVRNMFARSKSNYAPGASEYNSGYEEILQDRKFENLVAEKHELTTFILNNEYRKAEVALENILALIKKEAGS